jgi:membrane protein
MNVPLPFKARWREEIAGLLETLQDWPWRDSLRTLRLRFREDRLGVTASSLTFTTLISLVPLVTVMLALFTAFPMFSKFQDSLQKYFLQSLVPDTIAKPVLGALTQFAAKAYRLGTFGLVVLVFTALALMLTIDRTLNAIWRVRKPRPIGQRVLVYWAAVTLGPLLLGVSLTLTSYAMSASKGMVSAMPGGVSVLLNTIEFLLFAGALAALFHYVPNTHVRWRHALLGGLFTSAGFEVAKKVLGWYLGSMTMYTNVYGAFSAVPILLVWIYLSWVIVLLGAVVAAYAPSLQMKVVRRPVVPGYRFNLGVGILRELNAVRGQGPHGLSASQLSERLRTDPLQIEPLLDTLVDIDWAGRLDEEGGARYVLLCDPAEAPAAPFIEKALLDPSLDLSGFRQQARLGEIRLADLLAAGPAPAAP